MGRALPVTLAALLVAAAALARTASTQGPGALATYRALTPSQASSLQVTFSPLGPRALARVGVGPRAAVAAARADVGPAATATGDVAVRLGGMRSAEDVRVGAPPTAVYLVQFEGLDVGWGMMDPTRPNHELWVCVDARSGRVLWAETYR